MKERIEEFLKNANTELDNCSDIKMLNDLRVKFLGKQGELTAFLRGMKDVPNEEKPVVGQLINNARQQVETKISELQQKFEQEELDKKLNSEKIDITEPSKIPEKGEIHPLNKVFDKLIDCCVEMGFEVVTGPEIEYDYYNFEALNVPKDHPARDMQDSFYISDNILMRTQTSSVQIRAMENRKPPFRIVSPGRTYRADSDATHSPVFHQFEGLVVDENISMVDLKSMLTKMLSMLFGENTKIRFRPSYFPFTEPSVEVDASCPSCGGKGCKLCKGTGFMELLGAGMVNPKVLENCGIDSKKYTGFAFGPGVDRLAMVVNKIPDLRMMFENDTKFLEQLK
ncbi:MAG: phenylalanine--tRNA ligase subunit alpha [Clostridia bacterium]|nr:phenylalanine--tRNA ligase subunit alpha [Clostridia bacterium]